MKKQMIKLDIPIPTSDGKKVAYTIPVEVPARYDEELQDYILDGTAMAEIDRVKARHMGLLSPDEIKALRARLGVTQKEIAELLQIGAKSWSRWENGRERPSRSMNLLLRSLDDGKVDVNYLRSVGAKKPAWLQIIQAMGKPAMNQNQPLVVSHFANDEYCDEEAAIVNKQRAA